MPPPVWAVGQVLAAADVNSWFVPLVAYKTGATSRSSTTTPSADPDLTITLATSAFYRIEFHLNFEGSATANQGIKWGFTVPTGTNVRYHGVWSNVTANAEIGHTWTGAQQPTAGTDGTGNIHGASGQGTVFTSTTGGSITLNWAQAVSEASAITLHEQSSLILTRIG
jgi:hypothetical protein